MISLRRTNIALIMGLFSKRDRKKIVLITLAQMFLSALDLIGVVAIGLLGSVATLGITATEPGGYTKRLLNLLNMLDKSVSHQITFLGMVASLVLIGKTLLSAYFSLKIIKFLSNRTSLISSQFIGKLLQGNLEAIGKYKPNEILYAMSTGINTLTMGVLAQCINIIVDFSLLFILIIVLFITDPVLAIFTILYFTAISFSLYLHLNLRAKNLGKESEELFLSMHNRIREVMFSYREIVVRNLKGSYLRKIEANRDRLSEILASLTFYPNLSKYALETGLVLGAAIISAYQLLFNNSSGAIATLGVFLISSLRIGPAILRIQQALISIRRALGQSESTIKVLKKVKDLEPIQNENQRLVRRHGNFSPTVEFSNVDFAYIETPNLILRNVNFCLEPGVHLGIWVDPALAKLHW